ncbi:hypothetical protein TNCV_296181 [Trichonephila clavipes]|nr:hypothetical protein TNCV_296181 [Trichonephila clavipes]
MTGYRVYRFCKTTVDCLPGNSSSKHSSKFHNRRTTFGLLGTIEPPSFETDQLQACQRLFISRNHPMVYEKPFPLRTD